MREFGNVQEELNMILALFSAHVTLENVVVSMVSGVNGVENVVLKDDAAIFALEAAGRRSGGDLIVD